ncbi:MAG: isochorismatase family cysteine hydrolase, partial [Planctomycetota bacterium]
TALVILDGQNEFLTQGGALNAPIEAQNEGAPIVDTLNDWIAAAHARGMLVIDTKIVFDPGYPEAGASPYGIFAAVKDSGGFQRGSWGAETAEGLKLQDEDLVLEKPGMSAFLNPQFEQELKARGIENLILTGMLTDACVECTMRSAYDRGYQVYAATDAMRTLDPGKHHATIEQSFPLFSRPLALSEL